MNDFVIDNRTDRFLIFQEKISNKILKFVEQFKSFEKDKDKTLMYQLNKTFLCNSEMDINEENIIQVD